MCCSFFGPNKQAVTNFHESEYATAAKGHRSTEPAAGNILPRTHGADSSDPTAMARLLSAHAEKLLFRSTGSDLRTSSARDTSYDEDTIPSAKRQKLQ